MARSAVSDMDAGDIVAQVDTGARNPAGWQGRFILYVAFAWAVFQLYIASNVPFFLTDVTGIGLIVTDSNARLIHLAFAAFLAALAFPLLKKSPRDTIPWYDWVLGVLAVISCLYIMVFRDSIAVRAGLPTTADLVISTIGMVILAISVYRSLGLPLLVISSVFVIYVFFGSSEI
ncbi:MAG: C4-dicarboxylate ABC transporter, partial [SAR324 cluster bacterium]|nr:C4-dicarboxylate ABC transporter [SAR324 cluster bacterium]